MAVALDGPAGRGDRRGIPDVGILEATITCSGIVLVVEIAGGSPETTGKGIDPLISGRDRDTALALRSTMEESG